MRSVLCSAILLLTAPTLALAQYSYPHLHQGPQGTLTGVVELPPGVSNRACSDLKVEATNAEGGVLGHASTHAGKNRCSFTINHVQANVPVTVEVTGVSAACPSGTARVTNSTGFQLVPDQTKVVDLQLACQ